jgi:hypothetical protein
MQTYQDHLCKCNMCDTVMIDENAQPDARLYSYDEKAYCKELDETVENMAREDDMGDAFWACSECLTDNYLTDL